MTSSDSNPHNQAPPTIVIQNAEKKGNGMGVAGFVLALIALFLGWVPILGWILWLLGLIFSIVGMFKKPKGLAIAGLVISLIGIILIIFVFGVAMAAAAAS
jgi:hypothetical protein